MTSSVEPSTVGLVGIGETIRALAGMHGVRQDELAARVGISKQALNNIIRGRANPSLVTANKIALLFGVSTDHLLGDTRAALLEAADVYYVAPIRQEPAATHDEAVARIEEERSKRRKR